MPRADYDEIKEKFARFVKTWQTKNGDDLDELAIEDVSCRISAAPQSNDYWDQLSGLKTFVTSYPQTDHLHLSIYNYACRLKNKEAQQTAEVICESLNERLGQAELDVFYYSVHCAIHWIKTEKGWMQDEVHIDIYPFYGNLRAYFEKTWFFGSKLAEYTPGSRLPAIDGEFDLPWEKIPQGEDVLTEEEKIKDCFAKLYTSADYLVNIHRVTNRSKKMSVNSLRFGEYEEVRNKVSSLRYKRLKDRYWCHPYKFEKIKMNEAQDYARCVTYRVFGWKQRNHEYVWTRENKDTEHMCMAGITEFTKEEGEWKVMDHWLKLGLYETGPYSDSYYGDQF